jgi:hypothetical protein
VWPDGADLAGDLARGRVVAAAGLEVGRRVQADGPAVDQDDPFGRVGAVVGHVDLVGELVAGSGVGGLVLRPVVGELVDRELGAAAVEVGGDIADRAENRVSRPSCQRTEKYAREATRQSAATQSADPRTELASGS